VPSHTQRPLNGLTPAGVRRALQGDGCWAHRARQRKTRMGWSRANAIGMAGGGRTLGAVVLQARPHCIALQSERVRWLCIRTNKRACHAQPTRRPGRKT